MASNLRVDTILPSTGTSLGIGTASGTINFLGNSEINTTGVVTASNFKTGSTNVHSGGLALGAGSTIGAVTGVTTYFGDGSNLTGITQTTINNNANNRIITGSGTAGTLEGEANLTYTGDVFEVIDSGSQSRFKAGKSSDGNSDTQVFIGNAGTNCHCDLFLGAHQTEFINVNFGDAQDADAGQIKYHNGNNYMSFTTAAVERLRIDSSGNVGIGIDTINFPSGGGLTIYNATAPRLRLLNSSTGTGTHDGAELSIDNTTKDFYIENREGEDIILYSGSERMRINSEGLAQFKGKAGSYYGNASTNNHHQFNNTGNGHWICQMRQEHHGGLGLNLRMNATGNQEAFQVYYYGSGASTRFRVLNNGDVGSASNSYGGISDIKLKENIVDANSQWNDIKAVKVRNFNFKDKPDTKMLGVVAQEIETISPGLVSDIVDKDPDTNESLGTITKEVKYSILHMKAIKALQEAMTRIETLEAKVAALEGS